MAVAKRPSAKAPIDWKKKASSQLRRTLGRLGRDQALRAVLPVCLRKADLLFRADFSWASESKMSALNLKWRGKAKPTDVLSFPAAEPFYSQGFLGDLVICRKVMTKQARSYGLPPEIELQVLIVHGILHLLGYDHEKSPTEAKKMARAEKLFLQKTLARRWHKVLGLINRHA